MKQNQIPFQYCDQKRDAKTKQYIHYVAQLQMKLLLPPKKRELG